MTLLIQESGRSELVKRLENFKNEIGNHPLLADIFRQLWFDRCQKAIESLPMFHTLSSYAPETLPFEYYCSNSSFTKLFADRVERLSKVPGFSVKRYRQKFLSDGAEAIATLFEINYLGRFSTIKKLEPTIGGSLSQAEALIDCGRDKLFLECFALYYPGMYADLRTAPADLADRLASKILAKAGQLREATHPAIVAIGLSNQLVAHLGTADDPLCKGANKALGDMSSGPISGLVFCTDFRADQITGPFRNPLGLICLNDEMIACLRQPWIADPQWPLNQWSPLE